MKRATHPRLIAAITIAAFSLCTHSNAQTQSQPTAQTQLQPTAQTQLQPTAQTIHIPLTAIHSDTALPVTSLTPSDFTLNVDGQPRPFEISAIPAQASTNVLLVLPLGSPQSTQSPRSRDQILERAIAALNAQPHRSWNISILDDSGRQTPYTRDLKSITAGLQSLRSERPGEIALADWRTSAAVAISSLRDLPGRRIVLSLGDIFHQVLVDQDGVLYDNFQIEDVSAAAQNAGAVIYIAESSSEIPELRKLAPVYTLAGADPGPWLLLSRGYRLAGWFAGSTPDTLRQIQQDAPGTRTIDLQLESNQLDGQLHVLSLTAHPPALLLAAPSYFIAPSLARLRQLAELSPATRQALQNSDETLQSATPSPLALATQLNYFPHADGKSGTQIATTQFLWNATTPPPARLQTALELEQTTSGFVVDSIIGSLDWTTAQPTWNARLNVGPGAYTLRVAAGDAPGKITAAVATPFTAAVATPFTVEPSGNDPVLISSLVLGKSCIFAPPPPTPTAVDYLRAGNCDLNPDATHQYSPQDILWTLVRTTPIGELTGQPAKKWKANFLLVDNKGSKLAEQPVRWLTAEDGSYIATTAFPLNDPKLKLADGQYAIVFRLKGPGIEPNYGEDAPFMMTGTEKNSQ